MIRFFRQFRINSLSDNKVAKYLLYALGEIILVVIGILIALGINSKNDFRKDRVAEKALLENLMKDLARDRQELELVKTVNLQSLSQIDTVMYEINFNPDYRINDFVRHIMYFPYYSTFAISKGTYAETLSSGKLSLLLTDSLKLLISDYYEVNINYLGPDKIIVPLMKDLTTVYNEMFSGTMEYAMAIGLNSNLPRIDLQAVAKDPKFHKILTQKYSMMRVQIVEWNRFAEVNELLRNMIQKELDSRFK